MGKEMGQEAGQETGQEMEQKTEQETGQEMCVAVVVELPTDKVLEVFVVVAASQPEKALPVVNVSLSHSP
jgi:hypothetical protein